MGTDSGGNSSAAESKLEPDANLTGLRDIYAGSEGSSQPRANAYGDPEVCCVWNPSSRQFEKIDVFGPFVTVCLNPNGTVNALDFIGLCDRSGKKCQTPESYYVAEIWRFEFASRTFEYKDVRQTIGGNNRHEFCEDSWNTVP